MSIKSPWPSTLARIFSNIIIPILLLHPVSTSAQSSPDTTAMQKLKERLQLPPKLDWSSPDPCKWGRITCDSSQRITRIQISSHGVSGSLASSVSTLTNLQVLELVNNNISGPLPSLKGLSSLQTINLHDNQFSSIPDDFFDGLDSLEEAYLDNNPFEPWSIPIGLQGASSLKNFSANSANVVGEIPSFFNSDTFPSLIHLHMASNAIEGGLPAGFAGLGLQSLWLNGQKNKSGARTLGGRIDVLQNMTELVQIWLNMNDFTGPIPDLSKLTGLQDLKLRDNSLTGPVPDSLTKLPSLQVVNITNNCLHGKTPKFKVPTDLDVGNNCFCLSEPGVECDSRVNALISVLEPFGYPLEPAAYWPGNDPCKNWMRITCSNSNITIIDFRGLGLNGTISPNFAALTSVQTLILAHNNITGTIPNSLTTMLNLKTLDVSDNQLYGKVPKFLHTTVNVAGNIDINKDHPSSPTSGGGSSSQSGLNGGKGSKTGIVIGAGIGGVCALFVIGLLVFCFIRRKKPGKKVPPSTNMVVIHPNHSGSDDTVKITVTGPNHEAGSEIHSSGSGPHVIEGNNMIISIQVLRNVTQNFNERNILGKGGFGTVYKGELQDGTKIAVKRMNTAIIGDKATSEFKSEIDVLTKVRHRHLVALLGYCLDGNEKLLVFEFLPKGDLSRHLFHWKDEGLKPLGWNQRLTIALDVARGVEYLHSLAQQSFIHRDLKPSNILLGDDMRAKVADFGLVRLAPDGAKVSVETRLAGTFGYLAPEYAVTGRVTTKADVYSFGVILMEMITGRKALDDTQPNETLHLVSWFKKMYTNKDTFTQTIDPAIDLNDDTLSSIRTVAELAGHCCSSEPHARPEMGHAVNVLSSLTDVWRPIVDQNEDDYGIDMNMTLSQAVKKWQAMGDDSIGTTTTTTSSLFVGSGDNSRTSLPSRPFGFADSFTSADGR